MIDASAALTGLSGLASLFVIVAVVFAETGLLVGFFLPGDSLLFSAGVLLASGVIHLPLALVAVTVALAACAGDQAGYLIGRSAGPHVFNRPASRLFSAHHADRAADFFRRHGSKAVVLARFVPIVRTFTPTVAGVARMPYRRFVLFNAIGAVLWGVGMLAAGHLLGGVPFVARHVQVLTPVIALLSVLSGAAPLVRDRLRKNTPGAVDTPADEPTGVSR